MKYSDPDRVSHNGGEPKIEFKKSYFHFFMILETKVVRFEIKLSRRLCSNLSITY
jgi:hypothetical protein